MATKKSVQDLAPRTAATVKGGAKKSPGAQDNITLVRAAKPSMKDLAPKKNPKGGASKKIA